MIKQKKPLSKKPLIILAFLFSLILIASIGYLLRQPLKDIYENISLINFHLQDPEIPYIQPEQQTAQLSELELLPTDYEKISIFTKGFSQHEKTQLLKYAQTTHSTEDTDITTAYKRIYESNQNILIPQQYLDIYFLTEINKIVVDIKSQAKNEYILNELNRVFPTENISLKNTSEVLDYKDAKNFPDLVQWFLTPLQAQIENEYSQYISDNLNLYSKEEKSPQEISLANPDYTGQIYLDTNQIQLSKLKVLIEYIDNIYSQTELNSQKTKTNISDLRTILSDIDETANIFDIFNNILSLDINIEGKQPSLLLTTIDNTTYISPIYILGKEFVINDNNFNDPYDVQPIAQSKGSTRVPVFMYHQIGNAPKGSSKFIQGLYITPEQFEAQMAYLVKNNYTTIDSLELYNLLKKGTNPKQKTVMITFDDGTSGQYKYAFPILKKYGLSAVYFLISNRSGINFAQTKEMADAGMEIASHTATHPNLLELKDMKQMTYEISASKSMLSARADKPVYAIAYPGCVAGKTAFSTVAQAGYLIGASCGRSIDHYLKNRLSLSRVHAYGDMKSFKKLLSGVK